MKLLIGGCENFRAALACVLKAGLFVFAISITILFSQTNVASAKGPGVRYCFHSTCHRVLTLAQTRARVGKTEYLVSSYYDDCKRDAYNPCGLTSSGEPFYSGRHDNAASPIYPDGTVLLLWNPATKKSAVVRINNAGPYWGNRKLDVSRAVAEKLGFFGRGIGKLKVEVISAPNKAEATYKKNRRYSPVAGYIGVYETFETARIATASVTAVNALAASTLALPVGAAVSVARAEKTQKRWQKLAKTTDREKTAARHRLIALAAQDRLTRMARVSDVEIKLSNRPMPELIDAAAPALPYAPIATMANVVSDAKSAIKVSRLANARVGNLTVESLPVAKAKHRAGANIQKATGRRGTIVMAEVTAPRTVVTSAPSPPNRLVSSLTVRSDFAVVTSEIKDLRPSDFARTAKGHPTRRLMTARIFFTLATTAELAQIMERLQQSEDNRCPSPNRELPELPKTIARADANIGTFHVA